MNNEWALVGVTFRGEEPCHRNYTLIRTWYIYTQLAWTVIISALLPFPSSPMQEILVLLRKKGPSTEGVFRKPCNSKNMREIREQLNSGLEVDMEAQPAVLLVGLIKVSWSWSHLMLNQVPVKVLILSLACGRVFWRNFLAACLYLIFMTTGWQHWTVKTTSREFWK